MKRILLAGGAVGAVLIVLPMFAAFEAHVVNVTATIENALSVNTTPIAFGTVFPEEQLHHPLAISLSSSFIAEGNINADTVDYFIRQKPKCGVVAHQSTGPGDPTTYSQYVQVGETGTGENTQFVCPEVQVQGQEGTTTVQSVALPSLCPFLSKHSKQGEGEGSENDESINSFHGSLAWTFLDAITNTVHGHLSKPNDTTDNWDIDLFVPCFSGQCAQDHLVPPAYQANPALEHQQFGCDLWVEVDGIDGQAARPIVGALTTGYNDPDPASCTATVSGGASIQAAINAAVDGNTICVDSTYTGVGDTYPVNVDKDLTIAGLGVMGAANIPGGFFISDSGVTITGLEFTNYSFIQSSENAAIYIHNEIGVSGVALANTTIDHNIFTAPAGAIGANAKGIITEIGSAAAVQATGIDVLHNVFNGWNQAMFFNTTDEYEVAFNDILNNTVGIANDGPHNGSIHNNDFEGNIAEAVGVMPSATNGTGNNGVLTVNTNNFAPAGPGNDVNWYGPSVSVGADVNAENNWWSGEADAARTNDTAEVDTNPFEAIALPEN